MSKQIKCVRLRVLVPKGDVVATLNVLEEVARSITTYRTMPAANQNYLWITWLRPCTSTRVEQAR